MAEHATRVALLARAGPARERLEQALREAGAELVAVADPSATVVDEVSAASPQAILVALEPAIEDALDAYAPLLSDPGIAVIYDEAELAANRAGWDAARWVRHLTAKLHRHDDVLPPGTEPEQDWQPSPGPLPPQHREISDDDLKSIEDEAQVSADAVPRDDGLAAEDADAAVQIDAGPEADIIVPDDLQFFDDVARGEAGDADADSAVPAVIAEAGLDFDFAFQSDAAQTDAAVQDQAPATAAQDADAATEEAPEDVLADLEKRISGLSLAEVDSYGHGPERGAVVVEAGLGGPDAVRQLLAGLAEGFPRAVLVRLRLDGGRYDRLVKQMGRATSLTALLAKENESVLPGHVYFLPPGLSLVREKAQLRFVGDESGTQRLPDALPPDDSAILFLSGSDPALVDEAMGQGWAGALVVGQSPEDSYDAAAATRVIELGGQATAPAQIAERLLERWPPPDRPAGVDLEEPEQ